MASRSGEGMSDRKVLETRDRDGYWILEIRAMMLRATSFGDDVKDYDDIRGET